MAIAESILPEFDQEAAATRRVLEQVPGDHLAWQPHEKSMTLGRLASHIAEIPDWGVMALQHDSVDVEPADGEQRTAANYGSTEEIVAAFDESTATAREAIAAAEDHVFMEPWSLLRGGEEVFSAPKIGVLRSFVMNHCVHHRGQLTVYLRLLDAKVPSTYGPSADEAAF